MVDERLVQRALARQPEWSESLAVGSREYVDRVSSLVANRIRMEVVEASVLGDAGWVLREEREAYNAS